MQKFAKMWSRMSSGPTSPVMVERWWRAWRRSLAQRSVGREEARPVRTACRAAAVAESASKWRRFVTTSEEAEVVPEWARRVARRPSRPVPEEAEMWRTSREGGAGGARRVAFVPDRDEVGVGGEEGEEV